ncbi:hypothetical protein [Falsiroseomonas oryzae]|uniref:hypothetical protein n=1 Tax=Falsiroseomonas oryzae TaxID=2766473 RepID=UPI0022EB7C1C|nr:hypothetical protein [Roseomonas sp. MO-31]
MVRFSVELPDDVAEALARTAGELQSSPEKLLAEAAEAMLADRSALARSVARGREDFEAGRTFAHEEVVDELETWAREVEARHRAKA